MEGVSPGGSAVPGRRRKDTASQAGAAGVAGARRVWWDWWSLERWGYPPASQLLLEPGEGLQSTELLQPFKKTQYFPRCICAFIHGRAR